MESTDTRPGFIESVSDWEAGNADMPVKRTDYSRISHAAAIDSQAEDLANSDIGNFGYDVKAEASAAGADR